MLKRLTYLLLFLFLTAFSAMAQPPGGGRAVTAGHIHVNSADPDAAIAFWCDVMGTSTYSLGSLRGVSTLGVTILFTQQSPSGPSAGSAIDRMPSCRPKFEEQQVTTSSPIR